jgi:methionyl aminopeptidase
MSKKLKAMQASGLILSQVKKALRKAIKPGITTLGLDQLAEKIIIDSKAYPSFKTVRGYNFTTCININSGMVHGMPSSKKLKPKDVVTVDCGVYFKGFHTDSAFTMQIPPLISSTTKFLKTGEQALETAIKKAIPGNSVYDLSLALQETIEQAGYAVSRDLTGHGVGQKLHQHPNISCFAIEEDKNNILKKGQTLAIEIMYAKGRPELEQAKDGWTLSTIDNSLAGMFEHTVMVSSPHPTILT